MTTDNTLAAAVRNMDAALRALEAANAAHVDARNAVVAAAIASGLDRRAVVVVGELAWFIDPPGMGGSVVWPDGWTVSYGSPPVAIEGE